MPFWTHFAVMGGRAASAGGWSSTQARARLAWLGLIGATGGLTGNQALHSGKKAPLCHGECGREIQTVTCERSPGKDQVNEAAKGGKGGGLYFPLTAVQVGRPCWHAASCSAPYMHLLLLLLTACLSLSGVIRTIFQLRLDCALVALVDVLQGLLWQSLLVIREDKVHTGQERSAKIAELWSERKAPMCLCVKWL